MEETTPIPEPFHYSQLIALETEKSGLLNEIEQELREDLHPASPMEEHLFGDILMNHWRIRRVQHMEKRLIDYETRTRAPAIPDLYDSVYVSLACADSIQNSDILLFLQRSETRYQRNLSTAVRYS